MAKFGLLVWMLLALVACQNQANKPGDETDKPSTETTENNQAQSSVDWAGRFHYIENLGETAGGTPMIMAYSLEIKPQGQELIAEFNIDGYQTMEHLNCKVVSKGGNKAELRFDSYAEESLFPDKFKKDQVLTEMEKTGEKEIELSIEDPTTLKMKKVKFKVLNTPEM